MRKTTRTTQQGRIIYGLLIFLLMIISHTAKSQTRELHGWVRDSTGVPIPGVSVTAEGSRGGTQTDKEGRYSIRIASKDEALHFSIVGYTTKIVRLTGNSEYTVRLDADSRQLSEVVVTDGYFTQAKKSYTGAAITVSGVENENKPYATPLVALQGEVAGLNIAVPNGQPGADVTVRLRGLGSTALNSNPLYVVDGMIINSGNLSRLVQTSNVLAGINSDDIADVTVLKDASATAIYGSRGSNGVIVITTKKGRSGKPQVSLDAEFGRTGNVPLPAAGRPLNGPQFATLFVEGLNNANYTPAQVSTLATSYNIYGKSNNWQDLVHRNGSQQQYNVSVRGGNENTKLFASAGYFEQQATTLNSSLKRYTALFSIDQKINKRISFSSQLNVSNVYQPTPDGGAGDWANPIFASEILRPFQLAYNTDGTLNSGIAGNLGFTAHYNPLWIAANDKYLLSQTRALGNTTLRWNIWDQLRFTSFVSIDYNVLEESRYNNPIQGDGATTGGANTEYYTRYFNWLTRNQLDYRYNLTRDKDVYVDAAVGYEAQKSSEFLLNASGTGYPLTQSSLTALANAATPTSASQSNSNYSFNSVYSRVSVNFKNLYSLSGSYRRDGSSVFGVSNRYGSFWSVGGAWNIDQENFFRTLGIKPLSAAKLRVSYGTNGNAQGIGNYAAQPVASYGSNYTTGNGQNYNVVGNTGLTWESSNKFDVGADLGFFNDRLSFSADYYHDLIARLIQSVAISETTGFANVPFENSGAMVNRGVEIAVKGIPIRTRNFTWTTSFNVAFNHNEVTKLGNASGVNGNYYLQKGYNYYTYYTRIYAGVNPADGTALWYTDGSKTKTTTSYASAGLVPYKTSTPKYFGGFSNSFNYKGVVLSADLYYNVGNYVLDYWSSRFYDGAYYTFNKYQREYQKRWTTPGQITDVPKYIAGGGAQSTSNSYSSRFLYKGDFIRLKNVTLGYDLKNIPGLKSLAGVSKFYLYARASNLWTKTFDNKLPFDPESGTVTIPQYRTFTVGLNVGL
jgi:TonB-linked SusC/RagA family outer membrane protein